MRLKAGHSMMASDSRSEDKAASASKLTKGSAVIEAAWEHPAQSNIQAGVQPSIRFRPIQLAAENNAIRLLDRRVHADLSARPRMMRIENLAKNGLVGVLEPRCTTPSGHIHRCDIVRQRPKQSCHQPWSRPTLRSGSSKAGPRAPGARSPPGARMLP